MSIQMQLSKLEIDWFNIEYYNNNQIKLKKQYIKENKRRINATKYLNLHRILIFDKIKKPFS